MGLITTGGGLTNLRLRKANTQPSDVIWGKTFYAGDKNLKTGTLDDCPAISNAISLSNDGPSNLYARFPKGAYRTAASSGYPEVRIPMYLALDAIPGGNKGSWGTTINPGGSVTIPQGYHDGSGRVNANPASTNVRTATLNASGSYSGAKVFTAAGPVICAGCQNIRDGSYITVSWSGNQITVRETANSGQNRDITIVYAYYI